MRIRSTKPEFWRSKTISALPWDVRLVLKGLESYVDDNGVGKDDIALIASDVFPRDLSGSPLETLARLTEAISLLHERGLVARYELDGEDLLYIDKWKDLQRIDKPGRGRFPRPDGSFEYADDVDASTYRVIRETVARPPETVAPVTGEQGNRGTGDQRNRRTVEPASADLVSLFDQVWDRWPKRVERKQALERFKSAARRYPTGAEDLATEIARFGTAYAHTTETRFVPALGAWLNGDRWTDDLPQAPAAQGPTQPKLTAAQRNMQTVALFRDEEERQRLEIEG